MDDRERRNSGWRKLKLFVGLVTMAFAVTLALVVADRLSDEALGVLAGAVCGVGAAIPTSLIVVAVTRRHRERNAPRTSASEGSLMPQQHSYPPVIVVSPQGERQRSNNQWNALPSSLRPPPKRDFTVVGDTSANSEERHHGNERYP